MINLFKANAGINQLDEFAMRDSPVHRLHPMSKLITTILYITVVISFPSQNVSGLMALLFYPAILLPLSSVPYRPLFKRVLIALPFSLMGGISNLVLMKGTAFYVGSFAVSLGMVSFVSIMLKTFFSVTALLIFIATTPFIEITRQMAVLHVPKILCMQVVMTYRYIFVLLEEAVSMFTAYILRTKEQKGIQMKDMGSFLGILILRSFDRAERIYRAMKCRGFREIYDVKKTIKWKAADRLYIVLASLAILLLRVFNLSTFWVGIMGG